MDNILRRVLEKLLKGGIASRAIGAARGAKRMATGRAARREQAIEAILCLGRKEILCLPRKPFREREEVEEKKEKAKREDLQ